MTAAALLLLVLSLRRQQPSFAVATVLTGDPCVCYDPIPYTGCSPGIYKNAAQIDRAWPKFIAYALAGSSPLVAYSRTFAPAPGCDGDACFATAYNFNELVFPELTAAAAAARTGVPRAATLFDAMDSAGRTYAVAVGSVTVRYRRQFAFHGSAQILNAGAAVAGAIGTGQVLTFPHSVESIVVAIRYAYDQLQATGTTAAIDAQLAEFAQMSAYRLEDTAGATSCHCKLIDDTAPWVEAECEPYTLGAPYVCAC
jgi:hypothetical protein